jgi:ubiquitin-like 1-activating enzyme E1 B
MSEKRYSYFEKVYGKETFEKVKNSKILIVGAGGIGCELLKILVLSGFENLEIVTFNFLKIILDRFGYN